MIAVEGIRTFLTEDRVKDLLTTLCLIWLTIRQRPERRSWGAARSNWRCISSCPHIFRAYVAADCVSYSYCGIARAHAFRQGRQTACVST